VQSTLPAHTHDNASPDPRLWKPGSLTLDPQAWHRFRYGLGHHFLRHKASPYNEEAAQKSSVHFAVRKLLHKVEHPTLPADPLFYEDISLHELAGEIKNLISDKSPGDDGITNRMIQAAGPKFTNHDVFSTLWVHEIQPAAWQMSHIQPIYKGGDKSKTDPASYRGIYLSSALAKLFEGILISRLTKFTKMTENQFGTRSGRQIHDAIYCLLSIIQYNVKSCVFLLKDNG